MVIINSKLEDKVMKYTNSLKGHKTRRGAKTIVMRYGVACLLVDGSSGSKKVKAKAKGKKRKK